MGEGDIGQIRANRYTFRGSNSVKVGIWIHLVDFLPFL